MIRAWFLPGLVLAGVLSAQQEASALLPVVPVPEGSPSTAPFVALARERGPVPKADHADMQATIWSIDPAQRLAERRHVLGHSSWSPTPLLDSPQLLRWQTSDRAGRWRVLRLDLATFAVESLAASQRLVEIGRGGDRVYVQTDAGQFHVRDSEGALVPVTPELAVVARHESDWLLAVEGKIAHFDAAQGRVVRTYAKLAAPALAERSMEGRWDGGRFVVWLGRFVDEQRQEIDALPYRRSQIVFRELHVVDLDAETGSAMFVRTQAQGGSGVGVIPVVMPLELVGGLLRYAERKPLSGASADLGSLDEQRDLEWVTIDIATGKELLRVPYAPRSAPAPTSVLDAQVPEYLRDRFAASPIRAWGMEQDLAHAFFAQVGVEVALPQRGAIKFDSVCRTGDGARLLVLHRGTFHLCDLVQKTHACWPAPAALVGADVALHALR